MKFSLAVAPEALPLDPVLFRGDIVQSAKKARKMGYDAVEIHVSDVKRLNADVLCDYFDKNGMRVSALATGPAKRMDKLSLIDDDETIREETIARVSRFIELAARLGAGVIVGSLRGVIPDMKERAFYDERFRQGIRRLAKVADTENVDIYLEAINRYENNYLNTAKETLEYIAPLAAKHVKVHLDTFHMNIEEANMRKAILSCGDRLGYFHVADNNRRYPGAGAIDFDAVLAALDEAGYDGYVSLECLALPDAETAAQKAIETLKSRSI